MFLHLDLANRFAMEGLNMAFTAELHQDGKLLPKLLFIDVMVRENPTFNKPYIASSPMIIINC